MNRDIKRLAVPFLRDNHPEDMYMYEVIVETGPNAAHATTSQIYFVLTGEDDDTGDGCTRYFNYSRCALSANPSSK